MLMHNAWEEEEVEEEEDFVCQLFIEAHTHTRTHTQPTDSAQCNLS